MVTVKLQAVDQATLQIIETPQFLQAFSIDSPDFPCRDPAISSPRSFYGQNICMVGRSGSRTQERTDRRSYYAM